MPPSLPVTGGPFGLSPPSSLRLPDFIVAEESNLQRLSRFCFLWDSDDSIDHLRGGESVPGGGEELQSIVGDVEILMEGGDEEGEEGGEGERGSKTSKGRMRGKESGRTASLFPFK